VSMGWEQEAALLRASPPRHLLFLCVANSARSQMAEGIARALAPASVRISSAGSQPSVLNPLAVQALEEIGIDISGHRSKGVGEVPPGDVDTAITLCAEEVCPVWLGKATRIHWGLPDPAKAGSTDVERLQAFREARDELKRRLSAAFPQPDAAAVRFSVAAGPDLEAVRTLLTRMRLPTEDVGQPNQVFVTAWSGGALVGCVGLERHGTDALLRSLAVVPRMQGSGLGKRLHQAAVAEARRGAARALYLLTTTAAGFFARTGFESIDRGLAPPAVAASREFKALCPVSALCMRLRLR
jgi:protein-tyrosine-phosphatase/N-acetylglutamate synthase-like GNAT family acetyltransferase